MVHFRGLLRGGNIRVLKFVTLQVLRSETNPIYIYIYISGDYSKINIHIYMRNIK